MPNFFSFAHAWLRPIAPRDPQEKHRVATSLELLFDLIFVVAIATAGQQLHHAIIENHLAHGRRHEICTTQGTEGCCEA